MQDALIFLVQHISVFLENNPNQFLFINKNLAIKLPNDIHVHFALEKEIGKIAVLKMPPETLRSIFKMALRML